VDALVYACGEDWDQAWDLLPEEHYLEGRVENYDLASHRVVPSGRHEGRRVAGTLLFIRLQDKMRHTPAKGGRPQRTKRAAPSRSPRGSKRRASVRLTKQYVEGLVSSYRMEALEAMAGSGARLLGFLKRLLYTPELELRWRAAEALGRVAAGLYPQDPRAVNRLLQGLFTSVHDTAASSWGSIEAIGEIIARNPKPLFPFLPQLFMLSRDRDLLPEILWAVDTISTLSPGTIRPYAFQFIPLLRDVQPAVRAHAAHLLGMVGAEEATQDLRGLLGDEARVSLYREGEVLETNVGSVAREALDRL